MSITLTREEEYNKIILDVIRRLQWGEIRSRDDLTRRERAVVAAFTKKSTQKP